MTSITTHLSNYATYHRDRRNIATHFVGIPMIVVGVEAMLARVAVPVAGAFPFSLALVASIAAAVFYVALDRRFGLAMIALLGAAFALGTALAAGSLGTWLVGGVGLFAVGWVIQFVGHAFEGRKPAFADDLVGLLVGPLFVTAEVAFLLGLRPELEREIVHGAGPVRTGRLAGKHVAP
ncbi:MAG: Mpo1-like protein [Polyangiaceae bacterium]